MTKIAQPTFRDYLLMAITVITWGSAFVAINVVVPETGPLWLAALRVSIAVAVVWSWMLYRGISVPKGARVWGLLVIVALMNVVLPFTLIGWGQQTAEAGVAALLMGVGPLLALIGSHFTTSDDRITPYKAAGVALGFSGILTVVGGSALAGLGGDRILGQAAVLGGALGYAIGGLLIRRIAMSSEAIAAWVLGIGMVVLLIAASLFGGPFPTGIDKRPLFALLFLGVLSTGMGQLLRFYLVQRIGYATFSLGLNLIPVIGIGLAALLLGEVLTPHLLIALTLILTGLAVARYKPQAV
jgi:drug/metabolite transporter (DMT)-like permease